MLYKNRLTEIILDTLHRWDKISPVRDWEKTLAAFPETFEDLEGEVEHLTLINSYQWFLEDECRANYDDKKDIGSLKYLVDNSNSRRVEAINRIDNEIYSELEQKAPADARIPLDTPGSIYDRLTILHLKAHYFSKSAVKQEKVAVIKEQIEDLGQEMDLVQDDITRGKLHMKLYGLHKLYGATG